MKKDNSIELFRNNVRKTLLCNFPKNEMKLSKDKIAKLYENAIYKMCEKLSNDQLFLKIYSLSVNNSKFENDTNFQRKLDLVSLYKTFSYEKVGQIILSKSEKERIQILRDIKKRNVQWKSCVYNSSRKELDKHFERLKIKPTAVKGVYICRNKKCKSDDFLVWQSQTRSADEGMTTFRQCIKCGKREKE